MNQNTHFSMDQTPSLETLRKEFIHEFCYDDTEDNRMLELYHEIHGQSSASMSRKSIYRDREAGHQRLEKYYFSHKPEHIFRQDFVWEAMSFFVLWMLFQILIHTFNKKLMQWEQKVYHHYKNVLQ